MRARQQTYLRAKRLLWLQFVLTVGVPIAAGVAALVCTTVRPYTAALALLISVLDVTVLDRLQRQYLKLAAKIAEAFDCVVLDLPWNPFAAGHQVEPETLADAEATWRGGDAGILDWYPVAVGQAPMHLARII